MITKTEPLIKIYIANLGKYNEGELVGDWFDLPIQDIAEALESIGVAPNTDYEEYAIHDYKTELHSLKIDESCSIEYLNEITEQLEGFNMNTMHG